MPTMIALKSGQRFGRLTVQRKTDERVGGAVVWRCRCDCGKIVDVAVNYLRRGYRKSCRCLQKENRSTFIDETGNVYGAWRVIKEGKKPAGATDPWVWWECLCDPKLGGCGQRRNVAGAMLRNGASTSCGSCQRVKAVPDQVGDLKIIRPAGQIENGELRYKVRCERQGCGKVFVIRGARLRGPRPQQCCRECKWKEQIRDLTQLSDTSILGNVAILELAPRPKKHKDHHARWKCQCTNCGRKFVASSNNLLAGNHKSCGRCQRPAIPDAAMKHGPLKPPAQREVIAAELGWKAIRQMQDLLLASIGRREITELTAAEAAIVINCTEAHVRDLERAGKLKGNGKRGKECRIDAAACAKYRAENARPQSDNGEARGPSTSGNTERLTPFQMAERLRREHGKKSG